MKHNERISEPGDLEFLVPARQAAAYLGVSPRTLDSWRSKRRPGLAYVKIGTRVRYRWSDLRAFVEHSLVHLNER